MIIRYREIERALTSYYIKNVIYSRKLCHCQRNLQASEKFVTRIIYLSESKSSWQTKFVSFVLLSKSWQTKSSYQYFFFEIFIAVEKALPQVVPSVTPDKARILFYESRERGVAVVIVTVKVINPLKKKIICSIYISYKRNIWSFSGWSYQLPYPESVQVIVNFQTILVESVSLPYQKFCVQNPSFICSEINTKNTSRKNIQHLSLSELYNRFYGNSLNLFSFEAENNYPPNTTVFCSFKGHI